MQYVFIQDKNTKRICGICRKGWLEKIKQKHDGNLYDDCIEIEQGQPDKQGSIWYITPSQSTWAFAYTDENGRIKSVA